MMVEVKNLNGTSKEKYSKPKGYSSWLEYWEAESIFSISNKCACDGCSNEAKVGAHVIKTNEDNKWYVVPLCYKCNKKSEAFKVDENLLVRVNKDYLVETNNKNNFDLW